MLPCFVVLTMQSSTKAVDALTPKTCKLDYADGNYSLSKRYTVSFTYAYDANVSLQHFVICQQRLFKLKDNCFFFDMWLNKKTIFHFGD